jgi:hypothetical protein
MIYRPALRHREGIGKIYSGVVTDKDEVRAVWPAFFGEVSHVLMITFKTLFDKLHPSALRNGV